jgi:hypothetical protein
MLDGRARNFPRAFIQAVSRSILLFTMVGTCGVDTASEHLGSASARQHAALPGAWLEASLAFAAPWLAMPRQAGSFSFLGGRMLRPFTCRRKPGAGAPGSASCPPQVAVTPSRWAGLDVALCAHAAARGRPRRRRAAGGGAAAPVPAEGAVPAGRAAPQAAPVREQLRALGLSAAQLDAVCAGAYPFPSALDVSPEDIRARCAFLCEEAGVPRAALPAVLATAPQLLHMEPASMRDNLEFLSGEAGVAPTALAALVARFPHILK